jgi:hypothetical protein
MTPDQLSALEELLAAARPAQAAGTAAAAEAIAAGDVVQLRPGASHTWETSLMLVTKNDGRRIKGQIMRPHRGGCMEAWGSYSAPELIRIGRLPFPEPATDIKAWCYAPPCDRLADPAEAATYRADGIALRLTMRAEQIELERKAASASRQRALKAHGKQRNKKGERQTHAL